MAKKSLIDAQKELVTICENAFATRLVLLTLVTQTRQHGTSLH